MSLGVGLPHQVVSLGVGLPPSLGHEPGGRATSIKGWGYLQVMSLGVGLPPSYHELTGGATSIRS